MESPTPTGDFCNREVEKLVALQRVVNEDRDAVLDRVVARIRWDDYFERFDDRMRKWHVQIPTKSIQKHALHDSMTAS